MDRDLDGVQPGLDLPLLFYSLSALARFYFVSVGLLFFMFIFLSVTFTAPCAISTRGLLPIWIRPWTLHIQGCVFLRWLSFSLRCGLQPHF